MSFHYPYPDSDSAFEQWCLKFLRRHWNCATLELYRRKGYEQFGVDIFDEAGNEPLLAAQCKLRHGTTLSPTDVRDEVAKAKNFPLKIGRYAIITTTKLSSDVQTCVAEINKEHREKNLFSVELLPWDRIEKLLPTYADLIDELTPARNSHLQGINANLNGINEQLATMRVTIQGEDIAIEVAEAKNLVERRDFQIARVLLDRLKTMHWEQLTNEQKFIVQTNIANLLIAEGKVREASRLLLDAKKWLPEDERALTNEAIGQELAGEKGMAFSLAKDLLSKFPASARIQATWIRTAPSSISLKDIEHQVPAYQLENEVVLTALAVRSQKEGQRLKAQEYAKKAATLSDNWPAPKLLYGQACIQAEIERVNASKDPLSEPPSEEILNSASEAFSQAFELGQKQQTPEIVVEALLGRGVTFAMLDKHDLAEKDFREALRLKPDHPMGHYNLAVRLQNKQDTLGAINEMRQAIIFGRGVEAELRLCNLLLITGRQEDTHEATEIAVRLCKEAKDLAYPEEALQFAIQGLAEEKRWIEAQQLLDAKKTSITKFPWLLLQLNLFLDQQETEKATKIVDDTLRLLSKDTPWIQIRTFALLLGKLDRHQDALPLWKSIAKPGEYGPNIRELLACADRLGRDDIVLETCESIRKAGKGDRWLLHEELNVLEQYDMPKAVNILQTYLASHRDDKSAKFRLARLGVIQDRGDLLVSDPTELPTVEEVDPDQGRWIVEILCKAGKAKEGLRYCYNLLR